MQALPPHTRRTAELAAAIGREVPSELLIAVVGRDRGEVSADVEALERRGVVRQQGFARNRRLIVFSHALMHEAIYDGLDDAGRLQLHVQIVRTLQSSFADWADERPELFAHHFEASNMLVEAVDYWQRAGARASHMWSHETAYRHYQHVLDLIPRLPRDRRDSTERATRQSLGASLVLLKGIGSDELDANNARLAELAQEGDAPPTWQELWMQYVGAYAVCSLPAMHAADALLEARVATTADDDEAAPFHRYFLALTRGMTYVHHGLLSQAREQLGAARTMREPLLPQLTSLFEQSAAVAPSVYLTWVDMLAGDLDAAWKTQVDEETAYPTGSSTQLNALAFGYTIAMIVEDHDRARARIKTVLEEGESVLLPGHTAIARLGAELISLRESLRGVSARPLTADPRSRDAAIASLAAMWKELMSWHAGALRASSVVHCAMIAEVCVDVLRHPEADAALRDAALAQARTAIQFALDVLSDEGGEAMHRYYSSELDRVRARLALWQGDATAAQALLDSARKRCARVAVEGGVEPKLLSDRIARTAEELSGT